MSKAEQRALEEYPPQTIHFTNRYPKRVQSFKVDAHAPARKIYIKGYHQAQEDSKLTKEDVALLCSIIYDYNAQIRENKFSIPDDEQYYNNIAERFNNCRNVLNN